MARKEQTTQSTEASPEEGPTKPPVKKSTIACAGCAGVFAIGLIVAIILLQAWDARDSRLYKGKPLPKNVAYIGWWIGDGTVSARIDTFARAGDRLACDFAIRNDSNQPITVKEIGRTIIAQPLDALLNMQELPLTLIEGDQPMKVTDDENVLGIQRDIFGRTVLFVPAEADTAEKPPAFTLKPREVKRIRYRPRGAQNLMPASALRIAILLDDGQPPHPFYFLRKSAGIGGLFERGVEKAVQGPGGAP